MLNSSIWPVDRTIRFNHSETERILEQWQWTGPLHSPELQHYWNPTIRLFSVKSITLMGGGCLTTLQICSWCILQPQPTGLKEIRIETKWELTKSKRCQKTYRFVANETELLLPFISRSGFISQLRVLLNDVVAWILLPVSSSTHQQRLL